MIKYNNSNINDWYYDTSDIIKVYRNNAVCYYKIISSGDTPTQVPCYAVVDDISQYSDTEFEDVFNKADEKWYKLNNLNQYEEYGVYGDSIASGSSRLPEGYTEVEYIRNSNYNAYINTGVLLFDNTQNTYTITVRLTSEFHSNLSCATIISSELPVLPYYGALYRYKCSSTVDQLEFAGGTSNYSSSVVDNGDGTRTITMQSTGNTSWTISCPLTYCCSFSDTGYTTPYRFSDTTIYSATIVKNGSTVRDFVPAKRNSDSVYGLYDLINDVFYTSPNGNNFSGGSAVTPTAATYYQGKLAIVDGYEYQYSGNSWVNVGEVSGGTVEYPIYYDEKSDPPDNLSFSSMTEAEEYECPWVGMQATIDGVTYIFSGDSQSGYEWVESVDFQKQYLTFVATESGTFKFSGNSINYSLDNGVTWTTLASNTNSPTVSAGNKILWKATLTPSSNGIGRFYSSGLFVVEGNAMSLLFGDNFNEQTSLVGKNYAFNSLFSGCTNVTSAENLSLPATILSTSCYQYMFLDCSNLSIAPSVLPATSLAENCYNGMFGNCTSLTTSPQILTTTLVNKCCQYMFINCSSLNSVTCLATNPSTSHTTSWLSGVAASGTFYKSPNATWSTGDSGIPSTWTVQDYQGYYI